MRAENQAADNRELQATNERLRQELQRAQDQLDQTQQLLRQQQQQNEQLRKQPLTLCYPGDFDGAQVRDLIPSEIE